MFPIYVFRFGSTDLNEPRHGRVFSFYFFYQQKAKRSHVDVPVMRATATFNLELISSSRDGMVVAVLRFE
jgi:hypothetical protein